jgi:hypothetical protein
MSWCAPEDLPTRCRAIWAEALDFVHRRRDPLEYTGTVASLMDLYIKHSSSIWPRRIRRDAGLPDTFWNRDLRAGAIAEGSMAGASADDRAKQAGHSVKINRKV